MFRTLQVCTVMAAILPLLMSAGAPRAADPIEVNITYFGHAKQELPPLSLLEPILDDEGLKGAQQAIKDNHTTGGFLGHNYTLNEIIVPEEETVSGQFQAALDAGNRLFVADLTASDLKEIIPAAEEAGALIFNSRAPDDELRRDVCSANVFHVTPSRAMLADALAQYLMWKRWDEWVLIHGSHPEDQLLADAYRRAANRYGAKIVEERVYEDTGGGRRIESGHVQVQRQMPAFTQDMPGHDVLLAADEADVFGEYLPYMTWDPRPVAGSAGLVPTSWSRAHEQWGGTQLQRRFEEFAGRWMKPRDFDVWLATRVIGEAVTRTNTNDPDSLRDYIVSDGFEIAAFKGEALTFRQWNQQMRQPVLVGTARILVSVSPQEQYIHERTHLDTLGYDKTETNCDISSL